MDGVKLMNNKIVLTGATGFLGRNLVSLLLNDKDAEIFLLTRSPSCPPNLSQYANDERVHFIQGDVERPGVFLFKDREFLKKEATHILHLAALTAFLEEERPAITKLNYHGTKHIVNFAQECKKLENLVYISTAYAVNQMQNKYIIYEDEIQPPIGFGNPYEETKFLAEELVRKSKRPFSIYRPSIFAGTKLLGQMI